MSAAARRRIALAQKKRWAAYKAAKGTPAKPKPQKRMLSAAGRARIVAATKKRWAAYRKAQQAAKAAPVKKAARKKAVKKAPRTKTTQEPAQQVAAAPATE